MEVRHVYGSGGRHQMAIMLSLSPLTTLFAAISSTHHRSHDFSQTIGLDADPSGQFSGPCTNSRMSVRFRLSARRLAKLSGNCATGGANHIRSSLLVVAEDAAAVSTAEVGSS